LNPVTRSLAARLNDPQVTDFVVYWDALESLVIRVYRTGQATPEDEAEYQHVQSWMRQAYPQWQDGLRPHWTQAKVAGEIIREDPFLRLMSADAAGDFVGNWEAVQTLPAAREALNGLLIALINENV
jgi:hypothetical protein